MCLMLYALHMLDVICAGVRGASNTYAYNGVLEAPLTPTRRC
jgi:hypothetical protein